MNAEKKAGSIHFRLLINLLLPLLVLIGGAILVSRSIQKNIVSENIETMKEMTLHDENSVSNSLELRYEVLEGLADSFRRAQPGTVQEAQQLLQESLKFVPGARELVLVDEGGTVYKNSGLIAVRKEVRDLCAANSGKFAARYNRDDAMNEMRREELMVAVPADFSVDGVHFQKLLAVLDLRILEGELKIDSYGGMGYTSIVDVNGNYIVNVNQNHSFFTFDNFFEDTKNASFPNHASAEEVLQEAALSGSCSDTYTLDGQDYIAVISALNNADWFMVTTVPISVFSRETQRIMNTVYLLLGAFILMTLFGGISFARQRRQRGELEAAEERAKNLAIIEEQNNELEEKQKALEDALAMAQSANRAKTVFLNNMSHDIRTPMNAIIGFTGLASSHIDNKEQVQDYLAKIGQSSEHLLSLINDVLDMSRIESGKMNIEEKDEDLSTILHTLRSIVQADIHSKELDLFVDCDVNDQFIFCDKLRLNQVLLNILSNSIKYTRPGGMVSLRVKQTGVSENGYGHYEFRIKDNGMGMNEEFLKTIYEPFTRVRSSTISGIQGTGLGMAITKNIVDMMGGTIEIQSKEGEGTETTLNFDFRLAEGEIEPLRIAQLEGLRSLVVDDDFNACRSISKMLHDAGMRSEWCASGKEAVIRTEDARALGDLFKVYIIDWMMPDMNGIETTRRIRQIVGDSAPIIVLTAYDWSDIEDEAREAGVTAFISKPLFPSDLHTVLNRCCGESESLSGNEEAAPEYNFTGKKILLVEDNEMNREIAEEILEEDGFIIDTAEDGSIAVEKMKAAAPGQYDLILMDVQMPVMDGYEATKAIRALPDGEKANITILAMTANAFEEDRRDALASGMNGFLTKPIELEKLKTTLAKYLL